MKVLKDVPVSSTDAHLMVQSLTKYEESDWDNEKIVKALTKECDLSSEEAHEIAEKVRDELRSLKKTEINVKTLKTIINYHLFINGHNGRMLSDQVTIGMSLRDMRALIMEKSDENSNVSGNSPEAISMTLAEHSKKQFALRDVFSPEVAKAHLEAKIHIHDMGQINRVYAFSKVTKIIIRDPNGNEESITLIDLWDKFSDVKEEKINETQYVKEIADRGYTVKDSEGFVPLVRIIISKESKDMVKFKLIDGSIIKVSNDHACVIKRDKKLVLIRADEVNLSDTFIRKV